MNPVSAVLMAAGLLVAVAAGVRALLMPDALTRLHVLAPVTSVAGPLVGAAVCVANGWGLTTAQVLVVVVLLAVTGPVLGSATGRLAAGRDQDETSREPR